MRRLGMWVLVGLLAACGGGETSTRPAGAGGLGADGTGGTGGGGAPASGGATSGGAAGSAVGGSGGAAGSAGSGAGGSGIGGSGMLVGECAGSFSNVATLFAGDPNVIPGGLSITGDDLELYYSTGDQVLVRKRLSKAEPFSEPTLVLDLTTECISPLQEPPNASVDVSADGLRMYISCNSTPSPLRFASRADRNAAFVLASETFGNVGTSVSVSTDELVAYSATAAGAEALLLRSERASTTEPFSDAVRVEEISGAFRHPEISADGLNLFGLVLVGAPAGGVEPWRLAVATRQSPSGPFSQPSSAGLPVPPADGRDYSPTVSADCGSLYFTRLLGSVTPTPSTVEVATR